MNQLETAFNLLSMMNDANLADTDRSQDWQTPDMTSSLFSDLEKALIKVIGEDFHSFLLAGDYINIETLEGLIYAHTQFIYQRDFLIEDEKMNADDYYFAYNTTKIDTDDYQAMVYSKLSDDIPGQMIYAILYYNNIHQVFTGTEINLNRVRVNARLVQPSTNR